MDNIILCSTQIDTQTAIPNSFIENFMLSANGSYVKVYIYLTKCIQQGAKGLSVSSLADQMENTEKDVLRALKYWAKTGLIELSFDDSGAINAITLINPDKLVYKEEMEEVLAPTRSALKISPEIVEIAAISTPDTPMETSAESVSTDTISLSDSDNEEFGWLVSIVEQYLGKMLTPKDYDVLSFIYEELHFSTELILHLYNHCITLEKTSASYIRSVAIAWAEKNVHTVDDAQNLCTSYLSSHHAVCKAFGIRRDLGAIEKQFIDKWFDEYQFDLSIVLEACNRTMLNTNKPDFKYTDKILHNWTLQGVHTLDDIAKLDKSFSASKTKQIQKAPDKQSKTKAKVNSFNAFSQRSVSGQEMDSLEQKLLRKRGVL